MFFFSHYKVTLPILPSEPLELLKKPAPVPNDETADPAERRPAPCIAAGDRQGKPRASAGQMLLSFEFLTPRMENCS